MGLDSNAVLAAKWLKIYIKLQPLLLFFQNHSFLQLLQLLLLSSQPAISKYFDSSKGPSHEVRVERSCQKPRSVVSVRSVICYGVYHWRFGVG